MMMMKKKSRSKTYSKHFVLKPAIPVIFIDCYDLLLLNNITCCHLLHLDLIWQ